MSNVARHVRVTGLVQGVFFRAWTAEQADRLGLAGWVRNASDGSVEAHIEGDRWSVQQLIDQLHRGPPSAVVEEVAEKEIAPLGAVGFEIRH